MSVLAVSKYIRYINKEQAIFHKLRMGFSCPAESGRKGAQLAFPQSSGLCNLDESPLFCCPLIIEAFLSCVCWLPHHPAFTSAEWPLAKLAAWKQGWTVRL